MRSMNPPTHPSPTRRLARQILLLPLFLTPLLVAACGDQPEGSQPLAPTEASVDAGLATLTAVAAGGDEDAAGQEGAMAVPTSPPAAAADLQQLVEGAPIPTDPVFDSEVPDDPIGAVDDARATADAEAGVPNVDALVLSMEKLATFTPGPPPDLPRSELIYARNGSFWRISASGGDARKLDLGADAPSIWAPPEDPGRGWLSPDGRRVAFFGGTDAEMWVVGVDGRGLRQLSGPNLPPEIHRIAEGRSEQDVRLKPGRHYTLMRLDGADEPFAVLIDDLTEQRRGYARLRFVHAIEGRADEQLQVYINGAPFGGPMRYGRSSGEIATPAGPLTLELRDLSGRTIAALPDFESVSKQIVSIYLTGGREVRAVPVLSEKSLDPGTASEVRIFNATEDPIDVDLDGSSALVADLAPGAAGPFVRVPATLSTEQRADLQLGIYGNKTNEKPVAWSPDGSHLAFVGGVDGQVDLYAGPIEGPIRRLTQDAQLQLNPVWSPDDHLTWLAEETTVVLSSLHYARQGGEAREVDLSPVRQARGLPPTQKIFMPEDPVWVDGDRMAILPRADNRSLGIWLVDTRDGSLSEIYEGTVVDPDWSTEAGAFVFSPDEETGTLLVLEPGEAPRTLVEGEAFNGMWSPDGSMISYVEGQRMNREGWVLHVVDADGDNDRALSPRWPLVQFDPPVPGPNAKRYWLDGGQRLVFSRVGRDYGAAERAGIGRVQEAGPDLENWYAVATDGSQSEPRRISDLTQVFYLDDLAPGPAGEALAFTGLWYKSRTQQLWTMPDEGGKPVQLDGPVRWYAWLP